MTGTTKNGFEFDVSDSVIDNMELLDAVAEMQDENPLALSRLCTLMFGAEQKKRLYNSLRTEDGRVPLTAVSEAIADVWSAFGDTGKK